MAGKNRVCINAALVPTAPSCIELIPAGADVVGRDGRSWKNADPAAIVQAFATNGADLPIDIEHSSEHKAPKGDPAPAVGWIKSLEVRDGGSIWGTVEWTEQGERTINSREYRYISPVFTYEKTTNRIAKLVSVGLTNHPNLHVSALNRADSEQTQPTQQEPAMDIPKNILAALGLAPDATEGDVLRAVNRLSDDKNRAINSAQNPSLEKFVPRADHDALLERAKNAEQKLDEHKKQQVETEIETEIKQAMKSGAITPATADYHRACCRQDGGLELFREYVKSAPVIAADTKLDAKSANQAGEQLSDSDAAACALLGIDESAFKGVK